MPQSTIGVIYRHRLFVEAMEAALDDEHFRVVWTEADDPDLDGETIGHDCDLVLVEAPTRGEVLDALVQRDAPGGERTRLAVLTMSDGPDPATLELARRCGADACLCADMSLEAFHECLRLVSMGVQVFPAAPRRPPNVPESRIYAPSGTVGATALSSREIEIVSALRDGLSNKTIARRLEITESTVKTHLKAILRKIGASNRTQVAIWAVENEAGLAG